MEGLAMDPLLSNNEFFKLKCQVESLRTSVSEQARAVDSQIQSILDQCSAVLQSKPFWPKHRDVESNCPSPVKNKGAGGVKPAQRADCTQESAGKVFPPEAKKFPPSKSMHYHSASMIIPEVVADSKSDTNEISLCSTNGSPHLPLEKHSPKVASSFKAFFQQISPKNKGRHKALGNSANSSPRSWSYADVERAEEHFRAKMEDLSHIHEGAGLGGPAAPAGGLGGGGGGGTWGPPGGRRGSGSEGARSGWVSVICCGVKVRWRWPPTPVSCESRFAALWGVFMAVASIYLILLIPFDIAFNISDKGVVLGMTILEIILEVLFLVDILLQFNLTYHDEVTKEEVWNRQKIKEQYLSSGFRLDLMTSIPFTLLTLGFSSSSAEQLGRLVKLLRIVKISRLLKAKRTAKEMENFSPNPAAVRMLKIIVIFVGVSHYLGCLTHFFICSFSGGFDPDTVVYLDRCADFDTVFEMYTAAWLGSIRAMIGNMKSGQTLPEQQAEIFVLLVGIGVSSTIIGGLASLLGSLDSTQAAKNEELDNVKEFCRRMKVTPALRKRILGYFEYVWEIGSSSYNHQVYERLPPKLGLELRLNLKREFVQGCPLLAVFTGPAVVALVESMEAIIVLPNDPIVQQGQNVTQLFLINRGRCTVSHMSNGSFALTGSTKGKANPLTSNNTKRRLRRRFSNSTRLASAEEVHYTQSFISKSGKFAGSSRNNSVNGDSSGILHVLKTLHCGAHFGDHQVLGLEELSSVSVVSDGFGEIQVVPGEVLVSVLGDDPLLKATVRRISQSTLEAQQRLLRNLSNAKLVLHHLSERKTQNPLKRMASMHHSMKTGRRRGNGALHKNGERRSKKLFILGNAAKITASDVDRIRKSQVAALDKLFHHRVTLNPHFVPVFRHRHDDAVKEEISYHIAEGPSRAPSPAASRRKLSRAATPYIAVNGSSLSLLSDSIHEEEETKKSGQTRRLLLQEATSMSP